MKHMTQFNLNVYKKSKYVNTMSNMPDNDQYTPNEQYKCEPDINPKGHKCL